MIILNPGISANLHLSSSDTLSVETRDSVRIEALDTSGAVTATSTASGEKVIGPRAAGAYRLTAIGGNCHYTVKSAAQAPFAVADSEGRVAALVGPDGREITRTSTGPANSILLVADSMGARGFVEIATTGITDNGDDTATLTFASNPLGSSVQLAVGDPIRVNNANVPELNQVAARVVAITTSAPFTVTYTTTGPHSPMVGSGSPVVVVERSLSVLGFLSYLNELANGELTVTSNCAQGGASLAEINEIFDAIAEPARFGIFLAGRNDGYRSGSAERSYEQMVADATTLLDKMVRRCAHLVVLTTPPQDSTLLGGTWTTAKMQKQLRYETWLKQYGRSIGAIIVDSAIASSNGVPYRDPSSANGNPTAGFSSDGTHQSGVSAFAMAKSVHSAIKHLIVPSLAWPSGVVSVYANDPSYITDNALLTGTSGTVTPNAGTITGTAPDGWTVSISSGGLASVTLSQIDRTVSADGDAVGKWLRAVITNPSGSSQVNFQRSLPQDRIAFGDFLRALARFRLSSSGSPGSGNPVAVVGLNCQIRVVNANGAVVTADACNGAAGAAQALTEGYAGALVTPWLKTRDATNGAFSSAGFIIITINFNGAGGATLDLAHPHIRKLIA